MFICVTFFVAFLVAKIKFTPSLPKAPIGLPCISDFSSSVKRTPLDDFSITYFTKGAGVNTLSTMIYTQMRKGIKPEMYSLSTLLFLIAFLFVLIMNFRSDKAQKAKSKKVREVIA